jgi:predicted DsbA family dithiol-disulfide isomerase
VSEPLRFRVWSDYLCPWCYNAAVRLRRLEAEHAGTVEIEWKSYLLRPRPAREPRDLARFREYTQSWRRPAAEPDAPRFRVWQGDAGPPSHSVPAHVVARAAARLSRAAFDAVHRRLLEAYFAESRDTSDAATLRALWGEAGLPAPAFPDPGDPALAREVLAEHEAAVEAGVTGVPAVQLAGNDALVTGAHPYELYQRWVRRALEARAVAAAGARA